MADGIEEQQQQPPQQTSSWWGSWIDTAKTKSASVYEAVKKDLDELSTAVRSEATNVSTMLESTLKMDEPDSTASTVKKSLSSFFGTVTEALIPTVDDDDEAEAILITNDGSVTLTGFQKHLAELQASEETYLVEPSNELADKYKRWMEVVEQDQFTESRLSKHLTSSHILNDNYLNLVPEKISHMEFWKRYLFKKALLEDALANADLAEKRAKAEMTSNVQSCAPLTTVIQTTQPKLVYDEKPIKTDEIEEQKTILKDDLKWEVEDFSCNVELTEEEQARLLEEYDQEIQEREQRKSEISDIFIKEEISSQKKSNENENPKVNTKKPAQKNSNQNKKNLPSSTVSKTKNNSGKVTKSAKPQAASDAGKKDDKKPVDLEGNKNHFTKDEISSNNSDESWEKEFDLEGN